LALLLSNDPPSTETYPPSLHDALPICIDGLQLRERGDLRHVDDVADADPPRRHIEPGPAVDREVAERVRGGERGNGERQRGPPRSEEHTSELQSLTNLVCRLLLQKKKA